MIILEVVMPENIEATLDLLVELWNSGNHEPLTQLYAEGAERSDPNVPQALRGPQQIGEYIAEVRAGFPDFKLEIINRIVSGDQIAIEWTCTGTHTGVFQGIAATGRRINISGAGVSRVQNTQIVEERVYFDRLSLFQQLGAAPPAVESVSAGH
jgi:steroid delta-isomerase-like uncharacterized protein